MIIVYSLLDPAKHKLVADRDRLPVLVPYYLRATFSNLWLLEMLQFDDVLNLTPYTYMSMICLSTKHIILAHLILLPIVSKDPKRSYL
jgi:hypothetical protein